MEADSRPSLRLLAPLLGPLAIAWVVVGALIAVHLL
jgi:hypothetical protein